jgi:hypothetical protein
MNNCTFAWHRNVPLFELGGTCVTTPYESGVGELPPVITDDIQNILHALTDRALLLEG